MKTILYTLFGIFFGISATNNALSQCNSASYGQYPLTAYTITNCDGSVDIISPNCYAGEYSLVNVTEGYHYYFGSNLVSDFLTVTDANNVPVAFGDGSVTFTANYTGVMRLYTHTNSACGESAAPRQRKFSCLPASSCLNAGTFGQYPVDPYVVPVCDGSTVNVIATDCYAGEYSVVNLEANKTYKFSSSNLTDYLTVSDALGSTGLMSGTTPIVYNSTTNQTVRFYTHTDAACGEENVSRSRAIVCKVPDGCTSGVLYPVAAYTPVVCDNVTENVINADALPGQYVLLNLENTKAYSLKSSLATDYITVSNSSGSTVVAFGQGSVDFQPTTSGQYRFYFHTDLFCGTSLTSRIRSIVCHTNLGVLAGDLESWNVYPNPATENVTITASAKLDAISITTIDGKLLQTIVPSDVSTTIDVSTLRSGTYFITGNAQGVKSVKELVIE
jgi:hypothetical protein